MWPQDEAWQTTTLAEHAAQHLRSIQRLLPRQACVLAGVGCGAVVAHQLGVQLQAAGVEVMLRGDWLWTSGDVQMQGLKVQARAAIWCSARAEQCTVQHETSRTHVYHRDLPGF